MIIYLIKEYVAIAGYLLSDGREVRKGNIIVTKDEVQSLMSKNNYLPAREKLKVWKSLGWIDTEENRVTKRIHIKESGGYVPCVLIRVNVYETLKLYM